MKLAEKLLLLRRRQGLSQEELAARLHVSRQAVSRWESGSALPDAANLVQLSDLFGVTADDLLRDERDVAADSSHASPGAAPEAPSSAPSPDPKQRRRRRAGWCLGAAGLGGHGVVYLLSRAIEVPVPWITRDASGQVLYHWASDQTGHSYRYFIQSYDLELLTGLFTLALAAGVWLLWGRGMYRALRAAWGRLGRR